MLTNASHSTRKYKKKKLGGGEGQSFWRNVCERLQMVTQRFLCFLFVVNVPYPLWFDSIERCARNAKGKDTQQIFPHAGD
jgi:hypothetical protein